MRAVHRRVATGRTDSALTSARGPPSVKDNYQVKIMNAAGELVYFEKLDSFSGELKKQIDISKFGSGVYMLSIINSKNEIIRKIMVY